MANLKFEAHKLERELKKSGIEYTFHRQKVNKFKEKSGEEEEVTSILGLYHESNSYVTKTNGDSGVTTTKKQPQLLCLASDFKDSNLKMDDLVRINQLSPSTDQKTLKLVGWVDIGNWGIVVDLSFEEVSDGH